MTRFVTGFRSLRHQGMLARILLLSVVIWILETWMFAVVIAGFGPGRVPLDAALAVTVLANLGAAIPAGPGSVGTFEFGAVQALQPWGYSADVAMGMACMYHALQLVLQTTGGLLAWWSLPRETSLKQGGSSQEGNPEMQSNVTRDTRVNREGGPC